MAYQCCFYINLCLKLQQVHFFVLKEFTSYESATDMCNVHKVIVWHISHVEDKHITFVEGKRRWENDNYHPYNVGQMTPTVYHPYHEVGSMHKDANLTPWSEKKIPNTQVKM